jgi:catechol 2,3-dioxygenase
VKLFTEVLGFTIAEQVMAGDVMVGAFLTCSTKPHDIAFIRNPEKGKFHHCAFILGTWNDVHRTADLISKNDVSLDIGPTRHGITRGATIYFFDPSGNRNEVFAGGYIHYPDKPVITRTVEDPRARDLLSRPHAERRLPERAHLSGRYRRSGRSVRPWMSRRG